MTKLRVALAQINATVGDFDGNGRKIARMVDSAKEQGAQLIVFPELALCGYPPEDLLLKPSFLRDCHGALQAVAQRIRGITAVVGFPEEDSGETYNAAAVISDGEVEGIYRKIELPNYGVFDEERYFGTGAAADAVVLDVAGVPIGLSICEDIWCEGGLAEWHARENAVQVVLNLSASPYHADKPKARLGAVSRFARHTGTVVCYVNLVGGQDELVFDGGSMMVGPRGDLLARAARFREDLLIADIALAKGAVEVIAGAPPERERDRTGEVFQALVLGTRDYVRKNGFKKVLVGLSGGVDSSVTAAIAVEALGADNVFAVTMPSQFSSGATESDAAALAENLGISFITVPIESVVTAYTEILDDPDGLRGLEPDDAEGPGVLQGVAAENVQARIRCNILMALSNRYGWLVLATGNKSEIAVGYCTLYGDLAGGFAVIKDVPKTLVYKIANYVNRRGGPPVIPETVLERAPSAELRPGQKDTDSLPPYAVLDEVLRLYVEEDAAPAEIVAAGFEPRLVRDIVRMVDRNEYKRRQAPAGVKITPKAFGRDRRLPMTSRYRSVPARPA